jgi:hypothetical protein
LNTQPISVIINDIDHQTSDTTEWICSIDEMTCIVPYITEAKQRQLNRIIGETFCPMVAWSMCRRIGAISIWCWSWLRNQWGPWQNVCTLFLTACTPYIPLYCILMHEAINIDKVCLLFCCHRSIISLYVQLTVRNWIPESDVLVGHWDQSEHRLLSRDEDPYVPAEMVQRIGRSNMLFSAGPCSDWIPKGWNEAEAWARSINNVPSLTRP